MSRNVRAAATALALVGGVYLVGTSPAAASNMGFKLERSFDLLRRANGTPLQNLYWMSAPLFDGIGDVANTADPARNKCVGDPLGPTVGDGLYNADDKICDAWTARTNIPTAGTFTLSFIDRPTCTPIARNGTISLGQIAFTGTVFPLQADIGYQVLITAPAGVSPQNRAVIVGSHDPSFTGRPIVASPTCLPGQTTNCCGARAPRVDLINLPYHTMYEHSDEILCGLENVDWVDANADGRPDRCWDDTDADGVYDAGEALTGVFDGRVNMTVNTFVNNEAINARLSRNVTISLGRLVFTGQRYDLIPGDAYLLGISPTHNGSTWLSPHY